MVTLHQVPLVRPDDVLAGIASVAPDFAPPEVPVVTRLSRGTVDPKTGQIADPFGLG